MIHCVNRIWKCLADKFRKNELLEFVKNYQGFFSCFITKNSKSFNFTYLLKPKLKQVMRNSFFLQENSIL